MISISIAWLALAVLALLIVACAGMFVLTAGLNSTANCELEISPEAYDEISFQLRAVAWGSRVSEEGLNMNNILLVRGKE